MSPSRSRCLDTGMGSTLPGDAPIAACAPRETHPYVAAYNVLLAHAAAVDVYKKKFKAAQNSVEGMSVNAKWAEFLTDSAVDKDAAERHFFLRMGWFLDPIDRGDYPDVMRKYVGDRLLVFTSSEVALLNGSLDFNHYISRLISSGMQTQNPLISDNWQDQGLGSSVLRIGTQIGNQVHIFRLS